MVWDSKPRMLETVPLWVLCLLQALPPHPAFYLPCQLITLEARHYPCSPSGILTFLVVNCLLFYQALCPAAWIWLKDPQEEHPSFLRPLSNFPIFLTHSGDSLASGVLFLPQKEYKSRTILAAWGNHLSQAWAPHHTN